MSVEDNSVTISFVNLCYEVSKKEGPLFRRKKVVKCLLKDVSGTIKPGEMTALMGPSGAGKSTLLDVLAGRKTESKTSSIKGTILFNGAPRTGMLKKLSGYVEQEDILIGTLRVKDLLLYSAELTFPESTSFEEKNNRVEELITLLDLNSCAEAIIGTDENRGISGGQAKRVCIAIELLHKPKILYLDEPTSGLDSNTSYEVMKTVRKICDSGVTVICTIHQPSPEIYELFENIHLLVAGETVYNGHARNSAVRYFEALGFPYVSNSNPAEYLIKVINGQIKNVNNSAKADKSFFVDMFRKSPLYECRKESALQKAPHKGPQKKVLDSSKPVQNSVQFSAKVIMKRQNKINQTNPTFLLRKFVVTLLVAGVFASVYQGPSTNDQGIRAIFSVIVLCVVLLIMLASEYIEEYIVERAFVFKERNTGKYSGFVYFASKPILELPFLVTRTLVFSLIIYFACDLRSNVECFFYFVLVFYMAHELSHSSAQLFTAISPTRDVAAMLVMQVCLIFAVFSGFFITERNIPDYLMWIYYLSPAHYAIAGLVINNFEDETKYIGNVSASKYGSGTGSEIISGIGYPTDGFLSSKWNNFILLVVIAVIVRSCACLAIIYARPIRR
eukprot:Nk52_evm73s2367 gene=Nk52_evmTU73s2367